MCGGTFVAKAIHGCDGIMAHLLGTGIELPLSIGDTCSKEVFCLGHIDGIGVGTIDVVEKPPPILPQGGGDFPDGILPLTGGVREGMEGAFPVEDAVLII